MADQVTAETDHEIETSLPSNKNHELERTMTDMSLERTMNTIEIMEQTNLAVDPRHFHAFQPVTGAFLLGFFTLKCSICNCRLRTLFGSNQNSSGNRDSLEVERYEVVKCVACGIYVHRSCLNDYLANRKGTNSLSPCSVNKALVELSMRGNGENHYDEDIKDETSIYQTQNPDRNLNDQVHESQTILKNGSLITCSASAMIALRKKEEDNGSYDQDSTILSKAVSDIDNSHQSELRSDNKNSNKKILSLDPLAIEDSLHSEYTPEENSQIWTQNGPPSHWALHHPETLAGLHGNMEINPMLNQDPGENNEKYDFDDNGNNPNLTPQQRFSYFSKILQENLFTFLKNNTENDSDDASSLLRDFDSKSDEMETKDTIPKDDKIDVNEKLKPADSSSDSTQNSSSLSTITSPAKAAYQAYSKIKRVKSNIAAATVAGGVVGGVAGLVAAGPAGAYVGIRLGQTLGVLGCVTGGTLNASVLIVGAAAGYKKMHSYHEYRKENEKVRMLTIGEEGMKRKMMLVRPNVIVSEYWKDACFSIRREWHDIQEKEEKSNTLLSTVKKKVTAEDFKNSRKNDEDILELEESEIDLKDKIFLLVNRSLNDKNSLSGYTFKELIEEYRVRFDDVADREKKFKDDFQSKGVANQIQDDQSSRTRRQDAHGVIKFVTATLLDERPGLGASPTITQMSVTAVEGLVFGEIYDKVFEEIQFETKEKDEVLIRNIDMFFRLNFKHYESFQQMLSDEAMRALHLLCEAHSPNDKLVYCVEFLEMISAKFSSNIDKSEKKSIGADALLKLVCQHIIAAKISNINAESLFLEEFARDEQLLQGKEGYALVTLQAALHFLNSDENFNSEIFFNMTDD